MRKREEGSQYLRTLLIYAVKQVLSREEMRIRLSGEAIYVSTNSMAMAFVHLFFYFFTNV